MCDSVATRSQCERMKRLAWTSLLDTFLLEVALLGMGSVDVPEIAPVDTVEVLRQLHVRLDDHFRRLCNERRELDPISPVFALEHDLLQADVDALNHAVRSAVQEGLSPRHRQWWLPFVVYSAESGYHYAGAEYWQNFEQCTPGWRDDQRQWIRAWFEFFADQYEGAVPTGRFATHFTIIAWPITHSVLPSDLQRQLAQLLYEFSNAMTPALLSDPVTLGQRLQVRTASYSDRFRIFCENTTLVGQVAVALLSADDQPTSYLLASTLRRIVDDVEVEKQACHWLRSAQKTATRVRGNLTGENDGDTASERRPGVTTTDPKLFLKFEDGWYAYVELPDMTPLNTTSPDLYAQLGEFRGLVSGAARQIPRSALLYSGQEVQLAHWPRVDEPFLQLDGADEDVNILLAEKCVITRGPWWVFRKEDHGFAAEVKGKFVRPGQSYILIYSAPTLVPDVPWAMEVVARIEGVQAIELIVPNQINETEQAELSSRGIGVDSGITMRPVGVVASSWDGEGHIEWLAGESAILGIRSDIQPQRCQLTVDGRPYSSDWPAGEMELLLAIDALETGTHEVGVSLFGEGDSAIVSGSLAITIRDPQVRPEGATVGEGIRMLTAPARPSLSDLWDGRAVVSVDGPSGVDAELFVTLNGNNGRSLSEVKKAIRLPVDEQEWKKIAAEIRKSPQFNNKYDEAESCVVNVSLDGVGFAKLTCERGFQPLRWRFTKAHDGTFTAQLIDRTDGENTTVEFFDVEMPLSAQEKSPIGPIDVPPRGGLVIARSGESVATAILPTDPNAVFRLPKAHPTLPELRRRPGDVRRLIDGHAQWLEAELPADPFAAHAQHLVGEAISRSIGRLIGGRHWARLERDVARAIDIAGLLGQMRIAVGDSRKEQELAGMIALSLYLWSSPETLQSGFYNVIDPYLEAAGIRHGLVASGFLLKLADCPAALAGRREEETTTLLEQLLNTPLLYRAARFAVLGTRALSEESEGLT